MVAFWSEKSVIWSLRNLAERRLEPIFDDSKPRDKRSDHRDIAWFTPCVSHTTNQNHLLRRVTELLPPLLKV